MYRLYSVNVWIILFEWRAVKYLGPCAVIPTFRLCTNLCVLSLFSFTWIRTGKILVHGTNEWVPLGEITVFAMRSSKLFYWRATEIDDVCSHRSLIFVLLAGLVSLQTVNSLILKNIGAGKTTHNLKQNSDLLILVTHQI